MPVQQPETDMAETQELASDVDNVTTSGAEPVEDQVPADTLVKAPGVTSITLTSGKPE